MALNDIFVKGIALANRVLVSMEGVVVHEHWIAHAKSGGGAKFDPVPFSRMAIIEEGSIPHRLPTGDVITTKAHITFLQPVAPHGAAGRREPFDPRDRLTLPSGTSGLVVDVDKGTINPSTGHGFMAEIWIA